MADLTLSANIDTLLQAADFASFRTSLGLGTLATQSGTFSGTSSGTNTGDNSANSLYSGLVSNATHTGDVTGSTVLTIGAGKVTLAMQADMATASLVYRKTAGAGAPEVNTLATLKTDLGLTGTNSGDQTITLQGDVTGTGTGTFTTTIAAGAVDIAMLSATGTPSASTYLRGDNTWATVSGGIGGSTGATDNVVLRADGVGGATLQNSAMTIADSGTVTVDAGATAYPAVRITNTAKNAYVAVAETGQGDSIIIGTQGAASADASSLNGAIACSRSGGGIGFYVNAGTTRRAFLDSSGNFSLSGLNGQSIADTSLTELLTIAAAATSTTTIQKPAGAIILGVSVRVTTAVTCTSTFTVGDSGSAARFSTAAVSKALNSTDAGTKAGAYYNATAEGIVITPDTTPSDATGRVRVTIHYLLVTPPTS